MIVIVTCLAIVGACISVYGYYVEQRIKENITYKPFCDISDIISCSKPIMSKFGKLFSFSNTILGMIYYSTMIVLAFFNYVYCAFLLSIGSLCVSGVLAYILYYKIRSICLICTSIYLVNIALFITLYSYL